MTRTAIGLALATALACATGCGGAAQHPEDTVNEAVRVYNEDLRWGRFDGAAMRIPTKQRSEFVDEWDERGHDLKVNDFEIVRIDQHGPNAARAQVKVSWYLLSEQILRETSAVEMWERKGKNWMLVDEQRLRGHEMPGLPEPVEHVRESHGAPTTPESR